MVKVCITLTYLYYSCRAQEEKHCQACHWTDESSEFASLVWKHQYYFQSYQRRNIHVKCMDSWELWCWGTQRIYCIWWRNIKYPGLVNRFTRWCCIVYLHRLTSRWEYEKKKSVLQWYLDEECSSCSCLSEGNVVSLMCLLLITVFSLYPPTSLQHDPNNNNNF